MESFRGSHTAAGTTATLGMSSISLRIWHIRKSWGLMPHILHVSRMVKSTAYLYALVCVLLPYEISRTAMLGRRDRSETLLVHSVPRWMT